MHGIAADGLRLPPSLLSLAAFTTGSCKTRWSKKYETHLRSQKYLPKAVSRPTLFFRPADGVQGNGGRHNFHWG